MLQLAVVTNVETGLGILVAKRLLDEGYVVGGTPSRKLPISSFNGLLRDVFCHDSFYEIDSEKLDEGINRLGEFATHSLTVIVPNVSEGWSNKTGVFDTSSLSHILAEVTTVPSRVINSSSNLGHAVPGKVIYVVPSSLSNHPYSSIYEDFIKTHIQHVAAQLAYRRTNYGVRVGTVKLVPLETEDNTNMYILSQIPSEEADSFTEFGDTLMETINAPYGLHISVTPALALKQFNKSGLDLAHKYK